MPIIEERLNEFAVEIKKQVDTALSVVCNEDSVKEVKKVRAELTKQFKEFEEKRKEVKSAIMNPYERFNDIYNTLIAKQFKDADMQLNEKIKEIEDGFKEEKRNEIKEYWEEICKSNQIEFVPYEKWNPKITLSTSLHSLKKEALDFLTRVYNDLETIKTFTDLKEEILYEYKQLLDLGKAITLVNERNENIKELKQCEYVKPEMETRVEEVLQAPKITERNDNCLLTVNFKITNTKQKMKELKVFLDEGGYEYE